MMLVAGWIMVSGKELSDKPGVVGLLGGMATLFAVFTVGTPLASTGSMIYMPSLVLAMIFDLWAGLPY